MTLQCEFSMNSSNALVLIIMENMFAVPFYKEFAGYLCHYSEKQFPTICSVTLTYKWDLGDTISIILSGDYDILVDVI